MKAFNRSLLYLCLLAFSQQSLSFIYFPPNNPINYISSGSPHYYSDVLEEVYSQQFHIGNCTFEYPCVKLLCNKEPLQNCQFDQVCIDLLDCSNYEKYSPYNINKKLEEKSELSTEEEAESKEN